MTVTSQEQAANQEQVLRFSAMASGDPVALSTSENPNLSLTSVSFDGSSFITWNRQIRLMLGARLKVRFIDDTQIQPEAIDRGYNRWIRCDRLVVCWILSSMAPDISNSFIYCTNSKDMWLDDLNRFSQTNAPMICQLKQQIANLVQRGSQICSCSSSASMSTPSASDLNARLLQFAAMASGDPLALSNSEDPTTSLTSVLFDGSNFITWHRQIRMMLGARLKIGFEDGTLTKPEDGDKDVKRRIQSDRVVACSSMTPDLANSFIYTTTARGQWLDVLKRFCQSNAPMIYQLKQEITKIYQGNFSATVYYNILSAVGTIFALYKRFLVVLVARCPHVLARLFPNFRIWRFFIRILSFLYNEAIGKLVALGYDDEVALKSILRNGHCYGGMDVLTNILHNALAFLNGGGCCANHKNIAEDSELVFVLPILESLANGRTKGLRKTGYGRPPSVLVLLPTRELASQVFADFEVYGGAIGLPSMCLYGGGPDNQSVRSQEVKLKRGVDIVVGTPGRVKDHVESRNINLSFLQFRVLDEADEMLRMGFVENVELILVQVEDVSKVQTLLFSATLPAWVKQISSKFLKSDKKTVDLVGDQKMKASTDIRHIVIPFSSCNGLLVATGSLAFEQRGCYVVSSYE